MQLPVKQSALLLPYLDETVASRLEVVVDVGELQGDAHHPAELPSGLGGALVKALTRPRRDAECPDLSAVHDQWELEPVAAGLTGRRAYAREAVNRSQLNEPELQP